MSKNYYYTVLLPLKDQLTIELYKWQRFFHYASLNFQHQLPESVRASDPYCLSSLNMYGFFYCQNLQCTKLAR